MDDLQDGMEGSSSFSRRRSSSCGLARGLADLQEDLRTCKRTCRLARGLADLQEDLQGSMFVDFSFFCVRDGIDMGSILDQSEVNLH